MTNKRSFRQPSHLTDLGPDRKRGVRRLVNLPVSGLLLLVSLAAHATDSLSVVDAKGKRIGPVVDVVAGSNGAVKVPFRVGKRIVMIALDRSGFGVGMSPILYENS